MPADYDILPEFGLVLIRKWGDLRSRDGLDALLRYRDDPRSDPAHDYLIDMLGVTGSALSYHEVSSAVAVAFGSMPARKPGCATAFIAPSDVAYGIARMVQSLSEHASTARVGIFRTKDEAMRFLGLSTPEAAAIGVGARA